MNLPEKFNLIDAKMPDLLKNLVEYNRMIEFYARHLLGEALRAKDHERVAMLVKVADKAHKRTRYYRRFFRIKNKRR